MNDQLGARLPANLHHIFVDQYRRTLHYDVVLISLLVLLIGFGLIVLYSALARDIGAFINHLVRLGIGIGALAIAAIIQPSTYYRLAPFAYLGTIALLFAVMLFGDEIKGSQRWLDLPGLPRFQPSELLKISLPLMVGWFIAYRNFKLNSLDYFGVALIVGFPTALIFLQPDYGTAMILVSGATATLFLIGVKLRWFLAAMIGLVATAPLIWNFVFHEYHRKRIITLFNPEADPLGAGWNIIQSKTAIGSGGLNGKGLFEGTQSHLQFLPEGHTDFVFAVIGEELGFVCCAALLACYLLIFIRAAYISVMSTNGFGYTVGASIAIIFFGYVCVNVAMVLGLLPVVGLPLPLISYGGSSAITTLAAFGVLLAVCTPDRG